MIFSLLFVVFSLLFHAFSLLFFYATRNPQLSVESRFLIADRTSVEKIRQEKASLLKVDDSFKKIVVLGEETPVQRDDAGIITIGIYDFLLKENSLEL